MARIICFGECMIELSRSSDGGAGWQQGFAGDSHNVAVYLARLGGDVAYMTAVGQDEYSAEMRGVWAKERIARDLVLTHRDRIPGLYAIRLDDQGERSFTYWRGQSAARAFFDCPGAEAALEAAGAAALLYLSGITLSLFDDAERARILALAATVRAQGGLVAFDSNYRAKGWSDAAAARQAMTSFGAQAHILLPTFEDDAALFGDASPEACAARWRALGAQEVAVKLGAHGCLVSAGETLCRVAGERVDAVRDTTGAGDSFNAAYLAARLAGSDPFAAAASGNRLAAAVVQHSGAIMPRSAMPAGLIPQHAGPGA
jgi:2-dehydro-3-deoxygluconokinase